MSDEDKGFVVSDRRHFTADGEARVDAAATAETPGSESAVRAGSEGDPPADFASLILSLAAQGSVLIAGEPGDTAEPDLRGARHLISLLEMLRDKTESHRTPAEEKLLQGVLYELRMAYLERARTVRA